MLRARINATGEVVNIKPYQHEVIDFMVCRNEGIMGELYTRDELTIIGDNELEYPGDNTFDYWTRFEHQAAIAAMQGIMTNPIGFENIRARGTNIQLETALLASEFAHALVEKYKEKEERK